MGTQNGKNYHNASEDVLCKFRESYSEYFDMSAIQANVSVVFEKTPSYMLFPTIPAAIDAVAGPWKPKMLAILRNPVDRAWSHYHYHMVNRGKGNNTTPFAVLVNNEIMQFQRNGLLEVKLSFQEFEHSGGIHHPFRFRQNVTLQDYARLIHEYKGDRHRTNSLLYRGLYGPLLHPWVETFSPEDRLMILQFETFMEAENDNDRTIVHEVLGFAGLDNKSLEIENHKGRKAMNQTRLRKNIVRRKLVRANTGHYGRPMPPRMRQYLTFLYQPFNELLADLLGEDWRHVWD